MEYVKHHLIKPKTVEARIYQQIIFDSARKENTLIVLPTGLGKTQLALMVAAHRLSEIPKSKVLVMAPTRPLSIQHKKTFSETLELPEGDLFVLTGKVAPKERKDLWEDGIIIFATPQIVERDLIAGRTFLDSFSLLVFDEAHRAIGNYPYGFIAERYMSGAENPLILALTASPGGEKNRIEEIKKNLFIQNVEIRSEKDPDVAPYVQTVEVERRILEFPKPLAKIKKFLRSQFKDHLRTLKNQGFLHSIQKVSKRDLLDVQRAIRSEMPKSPLDSRQKFFEGLIAQAAAFRLAHSMELLETQGLISLKNYLDRTAKKSGKPGAQKSVKLLMGDPRMEKVMRLVESCEGRIDNPKLDETRRIVQNQLSKDPDSRIIVFAHYRDSVSQLVEDLDRLKGVYPAKFIGQAKREGERGLSQKKQGRILDEFRSGRYNILVSTAVGEEGLDIPDVDLALFYEAVPSEIRSIQRRGRTGRRRPGRVVILLMRGTRDESFYWSALHKERKMRKTLRVASEETGDVQSSLEEF